MFIISMGGGLGNQMYEVAFYLSMKRRYPNSTIKMDKKYAFLQSHNGIEVFDIFGINVEFATYKEVKKLTGLYPLSGERSIHNKLLRKCIKKFHLYPKTIWVQDDFTEYYIDVENFNVDESLYLLGPFANYKYFDMYRDEVLDAFSFPVIDEEINLKYKELIDNSNSVSVHLRKGDYIKEKIELASEDYYRAAVSIMLNQFSDPTFFLFTDDTDYAKSIFSNISGINYVCIEGNNKEKSFRDMHLMSLCKHNIIANSTFSFWGAYLNTNVEKIVIAPNLPFTGYKNVFACDDWILI